MVCSSYRILVDLKNLVKKFSGSKYDAKKIRGILEELSRDPDSFDIRPLSGYNMCYRARKGDIRFIITIDRNLCCIIIWDADWRERIYEKLESICPNENEIRELLTQKCQ
ncbi:type II toxin-antitoxin system RelE family toxin [Sulfurisphaera ohwakuensis]|uniref:mRNA-degrading endonuclease RelE of RelBE toxin-antitoxin system n=1 Tax=Sulfurisphaera ohwakuensis TaxID=69656 RepID=A0A650CGH6_SULOH|nr:hypothetical protein [Sulfurisphaera ohwakuensis]MBB5255293.1 mRNA-degrading endonuclease RelE of RelBE toxin-antitoxin system [Sulfurisphaera ohwakuensis]QGR16848.1 hypothetical protein D1869_06365 [Sulfurisphaera ohwakuensis]